MQPSILKEGILHHLDHPVVFSSMAGAGPQWEAGLAAAPATGIDWGVFGFAGRGAAESTFWLGTAGAHTLCHRDTYGLNLVVQLAGRKRWTLFPPADGPLLYPTRVPYEESTVFSAADLRRPDFHRFPDLASTHPHIVVLEPGEALLVPRHWWHLVENLETSVSINTWVNLRPWPPELCLSTLQATAEAR
ncbi:HSPB1-associated protein 1-like [Pollicipes pollicipes]|uniref:HSPB1-associated protein 1-like n=1 Tax=Pollicipes pollicipes TaxID=41117 RepID=UPI0018855707|nr:HSPB1-associated protein 1-like [Pollicipes pollicipes]